MNCDFSENATVVMCTPSNLAITAMSCNGTAVVLPCPYIAAGSIDYDLALCAIAGLTGLTLLLLGYGLMARNWRNRFLATSSLCFISAASTTLGPRTDTTCAPFFPILSVGTLLLIFAVHIITNERTKIASRRCATGVLVVLANAGFVAWSIVSSAPFTINQPWLLGWTIPGRFEMLVTDCTYSLGILEFGWITILVCVGLFVCIDFVRHRQRSCGRMLLSLAFASLAVMMIVLGIKHAQTERDRSDIKLFGCLSAAASISILALRCRVVAHEEASSSSDGSPIIDELPSSFTSTSTDMHERSIMLQVQLPGQIRDLHVV